MPLRAIYRYGIERHLRQKRLIGCRQCRSYCREDDFNAMLDRAFALLRYLIFFLNLYARIVCSVAGDAKIVIMKDNLNETVNCALALLRYLIFLFLQLVLLN